MYRSLYTGSIPTQMPPHAYTEWKGAYAGVFLIRCLRVCLRRVLCWMAIYLVNDRKSAYATLPAQHKSTLLPRVLTHAQKKTMFICSRQIASHTQHTCELQSWTVVTSVWRFMPNPKSMGICDRVASIFIVYLYLRLLCSLPLASTPCHVTSLVALNLRPLGLEKTDIIAKCLLKEGTTSTLCTT